MARFRRILAIHRLAQELADKAEQAGTPVASELLQTLLVEDTTLVEEIAEEAYEILVARIEKRC